MKNIDDEKLYIYERDNWQCQACKKDSTKAVLEISHRLRQGKNSKNVIKNFLLRNNIKGLKVNDILHHPFNLVLACAGPCNSKVDISFNPVEVDILLYNITQDLLNRS